MAIDALCGAVFCCLLLRSSMGLCKGWHDTVHTISKIPFSLVTYDGDSVVNDASYLPLGLAHASVRIPLYQASSLGRFILLLPDSF